MTANAKTLRTRNCHKVIFSVTLGPLYPFFFVFNCAVQETENYFVITVPCTFPLREAPFSHQHTAGQYVFDHWPQFIVGEEKVKEKSDRAEVVPRQARSKR